MFALYGMLYSQQANIDLDVTATSKKGPNEPEVSYNGNSGKIQNVHPKPILSNAEDIYTVIPNDGGSSQNGRAPMGGRRYIRTVYLVKPSEMAAFGTGGDVIKNLVWEYLTNNLNFGQDIPTRCDSLKIWMQNTTDVTNTKSTNWVTATTGMTLVYNGNYVIPSGEYGQLIVVNMGGPGTSTMTTAAGQGLYIAFEYTNNSPGLISSVVSGANVTCNYQGLAAGCLTGQSQTAHVATMGASNFRPVTHLGKGSEPIYTDVASIGGIYGLREALVCPCPDSNKITVIVDHLRRAVTDTLTVTTQVINVAGGGVKATWTDVIISDTIRNYYLNYSYLKSSDDDKADSIVASVTTGISSNENVLFNNAGFEFKYSRLNTNSYYNNVNLFAFGGVGPGAANRELAARFHTPCEIKLTSVDYGFFTTTSNAGYQIKIYAGGNAPGNVIYTSPALLSGPNTGVEKDTSHYFPTALTIPAGDYYVSLVQTTGTNPGFAYYGEAPIRQNCFYLYNGTTWIEMSTVPANVFNVRMIAHTALSLNIGAYLEGFFDGNTMIADTVVVVAHSMTSPYAVVDVAAAEVNSSGIGTFSFTKLNSDSCYLYAAKHRNHIQTWSHLVCENIDICGETFDFRSASSQTYSDNVKFIPGSPGGWAFYGGEVIQDATVDLSDITAIFNDAAVFTGGYVISDANGDQFVDISDINIAFNNSTNFVSEIAP